MADEQKQSRAERRRMEREQEKSKQSHEPNSAFFRKIAGAILGIIVFFTFIFVIKDQKSILPPLLPVGHIEESPSSHILKEPMSELIQRHMFEHADGSGPPGIIILYNCEKFECEFDLLSVLTKIAQDNPKNVYLAPGPKYDGKIIVTKAGKRIVLDELDEERIRNFITDE